MAPVGRTEAGRPGKLGISPRHSNVLGQSRAIASRSGKPGDRRNNLLRVSGPSHLLARAEVSAAAALAEHGTSPAIKVAPISREQQPALRPLSVPVRYASEGKPLSRRYVAPQQTDRATPASGGCRATAINMRSTAPTAHAVYPAISPPTPRRRDRKPPSARQACRIGYHRITAATMSRDGSMAPRTTSTISHKMRISTVAATRPWRINGRRSFEPDEPCGWTSVPPMSAIADVLP